MIRYARKVVPLEPPLGVVRVEIAPKVALEFTAPIHIIPETNQREHWAVKARRVKSQRTAAALLTKLAFQRIWPEGREVGSQREPFLPVDVTLTRIIGPRGRSLDAGDNRNVGFKAVRDGIADALQVDDGDESRVAWKYAPEEKGPDWFIRVRIEKREP